MRRLLLLLLGLLLILILSYFCFMGKSEGIKEDLSTKAKSAYANKSMEWVSTEIEGEGWGSTRILTLTGLAENLSAKEEAGKIAANIEGVTEVNNNIVVKGLEEGKEKGTADNKNHIPLSVSGSIASQTSSSNEHLKEEIISIPSTYFLNISKSKKNGVSLQGYVPNSETHRDLITHAQKIYGKKNVVDALDESPYAPKNWKETALLAIDKLRDVDYGEFVMKGEAVNFKAHVETAEKKRMLLNDVQDELPKNYTAQYAIEAPKEEAVIIRIPYIFEAVNQENGPLILNGYVPSKEIHKKLITKAKEIYGKENVIDKVTEAINAPRKWAETIDLGLEKLVSMDYGSFSMKHNSFHFEGSVPSRGTKNSVIKSLEKSVEKNYTDSYNIEVPEVVIIPAPKLTLDLRASKEKTLEEQILSEEKTLEAQMFSELQKIEPQVTSKEKNIPKKETLEVVEVTSLAETCQERFRAYLAEESIIFSTNKAIIKKSSYSLLNQLLGIIEGCPSATILIEGHTDSDGSQKYNQRLSENRANAVKDYLVKHGIVQKRLIAIGHGELYPIASNSTREGKRQNRRIEFNIKGVE